METLKFKTNINCSNCVDKVTPFLNETAGENGWTVDTQNPNKILSVNATQTDEQKVKEAVQKAGFKIETL